MSLRAPTLKLTHGSDLRLRGGLTFDIMFIVLSLPVAIEHGVTRVLAMGGIAAFLSFAFSLTRRVRGHGRP